MFNSFTNAELLLYVTLILLWDYSRGRQSTLQVAKESEYFTVFLYSSTMSANVYAYSYSIPWNRITWSWQQHACNWAAMQPSKPSLDVKQQYATYHMGAVVRLSARVMYI